MTETVHSKSFKMRVALGLVPGWETFRKFGSNPSVSGANAQEDVWPVATARSLPAAAGTVTIVSSSTSDDGDPAGVGAQTITLQGLDGNYYEQQETVTLDGTTNVTSTKSFLRINSAFVAAAGSSGFNVGNITMSIGGATQAYILAQDGQTQQCMYTVPANKYLLVDTYRWVIGRMAGATDCRVSGQIRLFGSGSWRKISKIYTFGPMAYDNDDSITLIPPKTEVRMQTNSSGATQCSGIFGGFLVETANFDV